MSGSVFRRALREPLLHFLLVGSLIFFVSHAVEAARRARDTRIVVDSQLLARIANLERAQYGVAPTGAQLALLVDNYVNDEVLYREALRLGLDRDDEIVRRRLIQKIEFLQHDASSDPGIEDAALRAWYAHHAPQFSDPARLSFSQRYFSPDVGGDAAALERARRARADLVAGRISTASDASPLATAYSAVTRNDATLLFGASDFVSALFDEEPSTGWSQPVRSGYGWHLFRVTARAPAHLNDFETVRAEVRAEYLRDRARSERRRQLDALRSRYQVSYPAARSGSAS